MQALPPPKNVMLIVSINDHTLLTTSKHSQVGIDTWNMCSRNRIGELVQPPLGLPFESIFTPDGFIPVARSDANYNSGILGYKYLRHHTAIHTTDWFG
jgi:hypothetical protein